MSKTKDRPRPFEGVGPYLDAKSAERGVRQELAGKAHGTWHARQIQNALGSLSERAGDPTVTDADRQGVFDDAAGVCHALLAAAEGCHDAVAEMAKRHGFKMPFTTAASELESIRAENESLRIDAQAMDKTISDLKAQLEADKGKAEDAKPSKPAGK